MILDLTPGTTIGELFETMKALEADQVAYVLSDGNQEPACSVIVTNNPEKARRIEEMIKGSEDMRPFAGEMHGWPAGKLVAFDKEGRALESYSPQAYQIVKRPAPLPPEAVNDLNRLF